MKRSKIFLLEDNLSLKNGLSFAFKKQGFDTCIARTLGEAYELWADGGQSVAGIGRSAYCSEESIFECFQFNGIESQKKLRNRKHLLLTSRNFRPKNPALQIIIRDYL